MVAYSQMQITAGGKTFRMASQNHINKHFCFIGDPCWFIDLILQAKPITELLKCCISFPPLILVYAHVQVKVTN